MSTVQTLSQLESSSSRQAIMEIDPAESMSSRGIELSQLFAAIPAADLAEIQSAARKTTFYTGQTIFFAGEKIQRVALLEEGTVKITRVDEGGSAVILQLVGPCEVVGPLERSRIVEHLST